MNRKLTSPEELLFLVREIGFLPFFKNKIKGFSIEEMCPEELWFSSDVDGPWEWKGPVIRSGKCVYGKFFGGKAAYISCEWFPDFANMRRDGYDFDARFDDGLAAYKDQTLYETIEKNGKILSKDLKDACNYRKDGNKGFETVITRLQMQTYVCVADFVYMQDKFGKPYGWGVAEYTTPEALFGYDNVTSAYKKEPAESGEKILYHLKKLLPDTADGQIERLIK